MGDDTSILISNIRMVYPSIFEKNVYKGVEGKYMATFLLPKTDVKQKKMIDEHIARKLQSAGFSVDRDKRFITDGDLKNEGKAEPNELHDGMWIIKASSNNRPQTFDRKRNPVTKEDDVLYSGCYVNLVLDCWIQNNTYGKRANANLCGIQFFRHGEVVTSGMIDTTNKFQELAEYDDGNDII